jgi:Acetokinase family
MCCIKGGKSIDTTMGMTPLEGCARLLRARICRARNPPSFTPTAISYLSCILYHQACQARTAPRVPASRVELSTFKSTSVVRCRLVMGTRCGDIDPGLLPFLAGQGLSIGDIDDLMNRQSGLLGLCGHADMRSVTERARNGDADCQLAEQVRSL